METTMKIILILITCYFSFASAQLKYNRKDFGGWIDADKDKINTRHEVLIEENLTPLMLRMTENGKRVLYGKWVCFFSGDTILKASKLDVDHVVPLKEAFVSGAADWPKKKKKQYANYLKDPSHLIAVKASENRRKGARDPCKYMPPINKCAYLDIWIKIKTDWDLIFDDKEFKCIIDLRKKHCVE
jgi:hypothetical protein